MRRTTLAGLVATAVVAAGCAVPVFAPRTDPAGPGAAAPSAPAPSAPSGAGQPARWQPCPEVPREIIGQGAPNMSYDCATVAVPRDWADPAGETFEIALLRVRAVDQTDRIGSLLVNPGGPGASGIETAVGMSFGPAFGGFPTEITDRFDIVGFDPRGVGRSTPIDCIPDADLDAWFGYDPDPQSTDSFDGLVALNRKITAECQAKYGDELRLFSTEQAARDIDAIRAAVGDDKLNYLGYSYGTLLGATYAQLFPRNIRAMVLDGAIDPRQNYQAGAESQARGFERAFDNFAAWCEATPARCPIAPDARAALVGAIDKARVSPAQGADGRAATAGWVLYAAVSSLYTEAAWEALAVAIANLEAGDPQAVFDLADSYARRDSAGRYTNLFDANTAVNCIDAGATPNLEQVRALQSEWRARYPLFGATLAVGMLACAVWPGTRDPYPTGAADGAPPILVVGTTGDPATPYEQSPRLAELLGVGRLLTWEGEGHTAYPKTACVARAVDAYLIDLTVPPEGRRCPAQ